MPFFKLGKNIHKSLLCADLLRHHLGNRGINQIVTQLQQSPQNINGSSEAGTSLQRYLKWRLGLSFCTLKVAIHWMQLTSRIGIDLDKEALLVESDTLRGAVLRFVNSLICSWRNNDLNDKVRGFGQCTTAYTMVSVALLNQNVSLGFMILIIHG